MIGSTLLSLAEVLGGAFLLRLVDGWVLSGDIGKIDENGYVYLTDRKDDMIISGGFNIWPTELENVISNLKGVREVAVVAAPHERWGEVPVAVVVLIDGAQVSEDDIVEACKVQLGSYKRPGRVILREEPLQSLYTPLVFGPRRGKVSVVDTGVDVIARRNEVVRK